MTDIRKSDAQLQALRLQEPEGDAEAADEWLDIGTCQVCGHYTRDRYCYATAMCREVGGADVL